MGGRRIRLSRINLLMEVNISFVICTTLPSFATQTTLVPFEDIQAPIFSHHPLNKLYVNYNTKKALNLSEGALIELIMSSDIFFNVPPFVAINIFYPVIIAF